jgi:hypothetical protein
MYQSRCTAKNSWWWAERLPETCRAVIPIKMEFSASVGFIHKECTTQTISHPENTKPNVTVSTYILPPNPSNAVYAYFHRMFDLRYTQRCWWNCILHGQEDLLVGNLVQMFRWSLWLSSCRHSNKDKVLEETHWRGSKGQSWWSAKLAFKFYPVTSLRMHWAISPSLRLTV